MAVYSVSRAHVGLLPSAGMGHINPFCRLAASLLNHNCTVYFIVAQPTVSTAESLAIASFISSNSNSSNLHVINLPLVELDHSLFPPTTNPFCLRFESIRQSAHLLPSLLPPSTDALVVDIINASSFIPISKQLRLPCHLLFTSSASMLSLASYLPTHLTNGRLVLTDDLHVPGFRTIPLSSIPPALREPDKHLFGIQFLENGRLLREADGILINTFTEFEPEAISALNGGKIDPCMPPVFPVGPLSPLPAAGGKKNNVAVDVWLDEQPDESVVYVSFGSLTAMSEEQIEEIGAGLGKSGQRYLWVVKKKVVDREEEEMAEYVKRVGDQRGLVVNGWVEQEEILMHRAVGGFVSHCGWNSLTEAAMAGRRVLGWARQGDQRVNGEVVRRSGLGVWMEEWCWEEEGGVVRGEEIGRRVKEMMEDERLRETAKAVGVAAVAGGRSSARGLEEFIARLMK